MRQHSLLSGDHLARLTEDYRAFERWDMPAFAH